MSERSGVITGLLIIGWILPCNAIKSQFEANCFPGCTCSPEEYKCVGLGEKTTDVFKSIRPEVYHDLDTVIVTGNQFGDLEAENLFGNNVRHHRLTLLDLSNNHLTSFGIQTLIGASRVETLKLDHNDLTAFADDQPLNFLTSLRIIDLTDAFGAHASVKKRADLVRTLFRNNHSFTDLYEVNLSNNQLRYLHPETFCNVKGLSRLILTNNQISDFQIADGCLEGLASLELRLNRFISIPSHIWKSLPSLNTLDFSKNPLACDCGLQSFHEFALDEANSFLSQGETLCSTPEKYKGRSVFDVEENFCRGNGGVFHWFVLLLLATVILFGYKEYRKRGKAINFKIFQGYSQLQTDNGNQPAFV
ncbi:unnamed protein product [Bursaphelenchus xylophilus]|uniref:(pine wood nematode) hypothetical protein n=1 Tax=Bursaphelenchus xylophilus TaxID=6326 RepID=A0A1I7S7B7_BURXY|nr:unnamed protein product [Bursaphelenchus xylophilus]CAG9084873.1 unnamed protein product [Bursaphelenchus xylophilus]